MSEMQQALHMMRHLPENALIENNGHWHFVGRVNAELALVRTDGQPATEEDYTKARSFGPRLAGMTTRTWPTKEAALAALAEAG